MSRFEHPSVQAARRRERAGSRTELRARGVVHTPIELAEFALGRVHAWLFEELGLQHGLANSAVQLLDPAVGTGVWLAAALARTQGIKSPRKVWGFDVDAQVLETARDVLSEEVAAQDVELHLVCENTLGRDNPWPETRGVPVIVGNPPWAARSLSRGTTLSDAWLRDFHHDAYGAPLHERRSGVLSDDYVRFWRWGLEQARATSDGAVVCLATNASFLDGPVHRGMRAKLRAGFDRIEVFDLGGNALLSRGGESDENIFGVRVGAALTLGYRLPGPDPRRASVRVTRVRGTRAEKMGNLRGQALEQIGHPEDPHAAWLPAEAHTRTSRPAHEFSLSEAFPFHREGIQTNRDELATAPSFDALVERLGQIADGRVVLEGRSHFDPLVARARVRAALAQGVEGYVRRLAYRPLETRYVCVVAPLCHRPRPDLIRAQAHSSWSLLAVRKDRGSLPFSLYGAARDVADACFLSTRSSCRTRVFPSHTPDGEPNLSERVSELIERVAGAAAPPELVMEYALGVLGSTLYRAEQGMRLKQDYARILAPADAATLYAFAAVGRKLKQLLCLDFAPEAVEEVSDLELAVSFPEERELSLRQVCFVAEERAVVLGKERVVLNVSPEIWEACVGHWKWRSLRPDRLRPPTACDLLHMLRRAESWQRASERADSAFRAHFS